MTDHPPIRSSAGRWFLTTMGLFLALLGGFFMWLLWRSFDRARAMDHWPQTSCVILNAQVDQRQIDPYSPPEFRVNVLFGYDWQGAARTSEHLTLRNNAWSSDRQKAEDELEKYPVGSGMTCYVDPTNPDRAIIKLDSKAPGYTVCFPALFVVAGVGIAIRANLPIRQR